MLVMDNTSIHHNKELIRIIESIGCKVIFLSPYLSDYNPIKLAFSVIKSWLKKNKNFIEYCLYSYFVLLLACEQITPDMAKGFYKSSIYF